MAGGYQYENNVLKFFPHAEGYVIKEGTSTYKHVFNYTDHLGNIRLKYCDLNQNGTIESNEILEENHYYPFGMKHKRYNEDSSALANKYKYNGKEWQDELGLNMYDYHARNYDPAIGRWMNIDPLAENSRRWTPYNYAYNNPIYFIDPDGMQAGAAKGLNYNWKTGRLSYGTDIDNAGYEDDGNGGGNDNGDPKKKSRIDVDYVKNQFGSTGNDKELKDWVSKHELILVQTGDYEFYVEFENLLNSPRFGFVIPRPETETDNVGKGIGFILKQGLKKATGIPGTLLSGGKLANNDPAKYDKGQELRQSQIDNGFNIAKTSLLNYMFAPQKQTPLPMINNTSNYYNVWRKL
ncbi:RHS repeat-associated core domain-containing protein [Flavobacterium azooxidireducens]|uniref:RHS repeat-associated core domain-containing protein n=1 Tax=Flavobacterium azooxidireducens TaxID=1871076 RepID=A0ABY4KI10_9FLAO|nr:RHS repeat-associated core domain-containing protein [Flavobacterium azooxidireducens]UPQ80466.1 RHS repeat-associated core domain-containing protein [Flavobacterium azooxidireducens]